MPQPEAFTTRIYNCVPGGFGEEKKKDWQDVSSGPILKKKIKVSKFLSESSKSLTKIPLHTV